MRSLPKLLPAFALLVSSSASVVPRESSSTSWYKTDKSTLRPEIYEYIEKISKSMDIPGFTVAITSPKGDEIWCFGRRDIQGTPVDPTTYFGLASNSKLISGVTLVSLMEQGFVLENGERFSLNSRIKDVDPTFKMVNQTATEEATVYDFLSHYSGLPGHNWSLQPNDTNESAFERLSVLEPNLGFRELWQYSNLHYVAAGHIVDKATGQDFYQQSEDLVFKRLDMEATWNASEALATGRLSQGFLRQAVNQTACAIDLYALDQTLPIIAPLFMANGSSSYPLTLNSMWPESCHGRQESVVYWTNGTGREWGAGGASVLTGEAIVSPAAFPPRYLVDPRAQLKWIKEVVSPKKISPSVIETVNTGHVNTSLAPAPDQPPTQYAIGTINLFYRGFDVKTHDGDLPGTNSQFFRVPNETVGVFVVTNEDYYNQGWSSPVAQTILDDLLGLEPVDHFTETLPLVVPLLPLVAQLAQANGSDVATPQDLSSTTPDTSSNPASASIVRRQMTPVDLDDFLGQTFSSPGYLPFTLDVLNLTDKQGTLDKYGFPADFLITDIATLTYINLTGPILIAEYGASFCSHIVFTQADGPYWNVTGAKIWDRVRGGQDDQGDKVSPKIGKLTGVAPAVFTQDGIGMFGNILTTNTAAGIVLPVLEDVKEVAPLFFHRVQG
ncbi:beta-lactamase/transpeptidase-like protein [Kockovaella imperatae]|uniref:Beta-lactamase/transpeptidase-like protein n=1 Tax=Kockovaella imperatae TaxID=4999 RepID=A0A1Y1UFE1_9TREE|nr:beta-lactamase/transpeptidase-like protein [Kockovaella imperatae]ORX36709.1 beta-lactamase/transpeptidase-like protein [Kockovaella imperatae]